MKFIKAYNRAISKPSGLSIIKQKIDRNIIVLVPKEFTANNLSYNVGPPNKRPNINTMHTMIKNAAPKLKYSKNIGIYLSFKPTLTALAERVCIS